MKAKLHLECEQHTRVSCCMQGVTLELKSGEGMITESLLMRKLTRFLDGLWGFIYNFFICYFVDRPRRVAFVNSVLSFHRAPAIEQDFSFCGVYGNLSSDMNLSG